MKSNPLNKIRIYDIPVENYRVEINDGAVMKNNKGEDVPYDYWINVRVSHQEASLHLGRKSSHNSFRKINNLFLSATFWFSDSQKSPRKPEFDIFDYGLGMNMPMIQIDAYKSTKFFESYIDILRNESPLFLRLEGEFRESDYKLDDVIKGFKDGFFNRFSAKGAIKLTTSVEKVGEGELVSEEA